MSQPPIDLMPHSIRARSQAGVVIGRYVLASLLAIVLVLVPATHARIVLDLAETERAGRSECERLVRAAELKIAELRRDLDESRERKDRYEQLALPLELSRVVATIVNELPESAALDSFDLRIHGRSAERRGSRRVSTAGKPRRRLAGELAGFAGTDHEIADFVVSLERLELCEHVRLDYTRSRTIRGTTAREFRISFSIDLDRKYAVEHRAYAPTAGGGGDVE